MPRGKIKKTKKSATSDSEHERDSTVANVNSNHFASTSTRRKRHSVEEISGEMSNRPQVKSKIVKVNKHDT